MANNGKGIGPNRLGAGRGLVTSPAKQKMVASENMTAAEKKSMKDNSVFGPGVKNVALPPSEKKKLVAKGKMVASKNMTAAQTKKAKDNSVFGPNGKNVAPTPGERKKDQKKPKPSPSPAKIRKALSTKVTKSKRSGDEGYVKPKETGKLMRKAGTRASGGGQDRQV